MSKKEKIKSKKLKPEEKSPKKKNLTVVILVLVIASLVAVGVGLKLNSKKSSDKTVSVADDSSLRRGETRPTLSPAQFSHPDVAGAYQIAKDIPHVLDALYCYCFCNEKPFYHKSVLSCFVDMHAAGWGLCMDEARRASELYKKGKSIKEISDIIDREFGK